MHPKTVQVVLITAAKRAGLTKKGKPWVKCHDLRRGAITWMLEAGGDLLPIAKIVGHINPAMLAHYDRRPEAAKRGLLAKTWKELE